MPWLSGWTYRRPITINNSSNSNALTDYQVLITLDTQSLISAGKMRSDGGDIRFTDSDGSTLLNYWVESGINTTSTRIWVKVPSIPASSTKTIYCYTPDTEVMTENGWINLKDFVEAKMNIKVATLNPETNKVEYHLPIAYIKLPFKGNIIHFEGKFFDIKVTPEHRMWYKTKWMPKWKWGIASEIPTTAVFRRDFPYDGKEEEYFILPYYSNQWKSGKWNHAVNYNKQEKKIRMDDWLEFLGFYLSEGSLRQPTTVVISQKKEEIKPLIEDVIRRIGYSVYYDGQAYLIHDVQLVSYLKQFGHAENKFIPPELKTLSKRQLKILLNALMLGDGYKRQKKNGYKDEYYATISKQLADDVQEIAIKAGYTASVYKNSQGTYIVYLGNSPEAGFKNKTTEDYEGFVYCLIVPHHLLYVRRNGKPLWSGNCYYGNPSATSQSNGDNTFLVFDDFNTADTNKWDFSAVSYSISNSILSIIGLVGDIANPVLYKVNSFNDIEVRAKQYGIGTNIALSILGRQQSSSATARDNYYVTYHSIWLNAGYTEIYKKLSGTQYRLAADSTQYTAGQWRITVFRGLGNQLSWGIYSIDYSTTYVVLSAVDNSFSSGYWGVNAWHNLGTQYVDWVFFRKYTSPEPTTSVGTEEQFVGVGARRLLIAQW